MITKRLFPFLVPVIYLALAWSIFEESLKYLVRRWNSPDYTYCYLVIPIALYMVWEKRDELTKTGARPAWTGLLPLVFGIFLFWLGELGGEFTTLHFAAWFVLVGILWVHFGWKTLRKISFPVVFLLALFPPPGFIHNNLTFKLKLVSSQIGVWLLQLYGMSAFREGNIIDLGFTQLQVVDACSGLRYLYPLIILAVLLAYFWKAAWWKKVFLVISAVPLTIITNSLRIAMTGVLYESWGPAVAEDFFHGFSGWLIFIFGLAVLLLEMWGLSKVFAAPKFSSVQSVPDLNVENSGPSGNKTLNRKPKPSGGWKSLLSPPQFVVAVLLLAATLAAAQGIEFREKVPVGKTFAEFPDQVGEWRGKRGMMEERFVKELDLSEYVIVDYENGGHAVNFYTAYYESQRKGESIHSPETCLPGTGWEFKEAGGATLPLNARNGKPMQVNRALMEIGASKQLSYFWFPQRDRVLTNAWELKLYNFWDALTRQRTDGALVRLITPVYPGEDVADADKRLVSFTQAIVPVLNEYLPE